MVVAITADEQDVYPPRVLVSVTGLTLADAVEISRVVGGERIPLRGGSSDSVTDTALLVIDAELPFGVPVGYRAIVNDSAEYTVSATTYTLPGGKVAVTDAITGLAAEVVILAWPDRARTRRASVYKVGGRNVVVSGDLGQPEGTVELYTETTSAADNVTSVIEHATSGTVQIRQPGGYDGIDSYLAVLAAVERRFSQDGSDQRRRHVLTVAEVAGWPSALEARGYTLQDIADAYAGLTLADLQGDFATLLDVAQGDFSP